MTWVQLFGIFFYFKKFISLQDLTSCIIFGLQQSISNNLVVKLSMCFLLFISMPVYSTSEVGQMLVLHQYSHSFISTSIKVCIKVECLSLFPCILPALLRLLISWKINPKRLNNCQNKRWSPFSCLMALSSVLGLDIHSFYPDMGCGVPTSHAHNVFNAVIKPRIEPESTLTPVRLLWTRLDTLMQCCRKSFLPNHIVPLFYANVDAKFLSYGKKQALIEDLSSSGSSKKQMKIPFSAVSNNTSGLVDVASSATTLSNQKELPNEKVQQKNVLQGHLCDIGSFQDKVSSFTDPQIYVILKNIWKPRPQYVYPIHYSYGTNRKFNSARLQKFPWLTYSGILDAAFCLPCVLFGRGIGSNSTKLN